MKAKNLKPMIISALLAVGFGATTVGTSFALFTDSTETNISITSGKVDVSGELKGLTLYSAEANAEGTVLDENNAKYNLVQQTGSFKNGGNAVINEAKDTLTLTNITPGDKVAFTFDLGNSSNVDIKYRLGYEVVNEGELNSTAYLDLVKGLETTVGAEKFSGLKTYKSAWTDLAANAELSDVNFSIYMPMNKDNRYQSKTAKIKLYVEAVQGNAAVSGGKEVATVEEDIISPAAIVVENTDTVLEAENADQTVTVKTTIPAATQEVSAGQKVELNVSNLEAEDTEDSTVKNLNFDLTLTVNGHEVEEFSEFIDVEIDIGPGYEITNVTHKGTAITNYTYDIDEGIIRFQTMNFSPFTVSYKNKVYKVATVEQLLSAVSEEYAIVVLDNDIIVGENDEVLELANNVTLRGASLSGTNKVNLKIAKGTVDNKATFRIKCLGDNVKIENLNISAIYKGGSYGRPTLVMNGKKATISNCNFNSGGISNFMGGMLGDIIIKDSVIENVNNLCYGNTRDLYTYFKTGGGSVTLERTRVDFVGTYGLHAEEYNHGTWTAIDCDMGLNWTSFGNTPTSVFTRCNLRCTEDGYNRIRAYGQHTFNDCTIEAGMNFDFGKTSASFTFNNTTYGGVKLTKDNFTSYGDKFETGDGAGMYYFDGEAIHG